MPSNLLAIQPREINFRTQTNTDWEDGLLIWQAGAGGVVAGATNAGDGALTVASVAPNTALDAHVVAITSIDGVTRFTVQCLYVASSAMAADTVVVAAPAKTSVDLPWGDLVVALAQPVMAVVASLLLTLITGLLAKYAGPLGSLITKPQLEASLKRVEDYGLNATQGALKGKTLSADVGNAALATMVQYGADNLKPWAIKAAGGLPGLAEKLFRRMDLEPEASAATVLEPVKAQIASGAIGK